ncbi:putative endothiapepsin [Xylogone sp. PMI_703]|nr:putative endothiapepsin [Xylogone sp. PMI_703]
MLSSVATVLAFSAALTQAVPLDLETRKADVSGATRFTVPAVHNSNYVRNGTAALLKAYAKYGLTPTKEMPKSFMDALSLSKRQDSSAPASPADGIEYLVPVSVGGQTLNLDFDSGSADFWVFSSQLSASSRSGHSYYTSSKSSTFKSLRGYSWDISYQDGSGASGNVGTDTVVIGSTTVKGQAVELATSVSSSFVSDQADGLVGLAFSSINTVTPVQQKTFFDNSQDSLDSPLFAAYLPANADGAYDFGFTDDSKYAGSITYTPVDSSNGFWEYASTSYKVGSSTFSSSGRTGISDTGTTLVLMDDSAVENYYDQVDGSSFSNREGGYVFPCDSDLPSLSIRIGSSAYATIPGSVINFQDLGNGQCFGGLQSVGGGSQNIYGDVFFNANYGVFSADGPKFGFAPLA